MKWDAGVPPEVRAAAEPHLTRWAGLLPTWCQEFRVRWGSEPGTSCQITCHYPNRWAVLKIGAEWLDQPPGAREVDLVHELLHVALEPMAAAMNRIVGDLTEAGTPLRELAASITTDGLESSVEDLARILLRTLPSCPS